MVYMYIPLWCNYICGPILTRTCSWLCLVTCLLSGYTYVKVLIFNMEEAVTMVILDTSPLYTLLKLRI